MWCDHCWQGDWGKGAGDPVQGLTRASLMPISPSYIAKR